MFCTVLRYLQVKYGSACPTTMTKKDAQTMGIKITNNPGWLKKYGANELSRDQVLKMISDVSFAAKRKSSDKNRAVLQKQLDRLLVVWPDVARCRKESENARIRAELEEKLGRPLAAPVATKPVASIAPKPIAVQKKDAVPVKKPVYGDGFYLTREWRELRYKALVINGAKCQCCGATRNDGVRLHVDHIKPRSKFPNLQLELSNLQILCEDCNLGKSNKDATDWR